MVENTVSTTGAPLGNSARGNRELAGLRMVDSAATFAIPKNTTAPIALLQLSLSQKLIDDGIKDGLPVAGPLTHMRNDDGVAMNQYTALADSLSSTSSSSFAHTY